MSGWGILASGIGGGANAVSDITKGMIDQDRRLESAKAISDIDEQKQLRIAERAQQMRRDEQTYNTTGQGSDELLLFRQKQDKAALDAKVSEASSPELRQANIDNVNSLTLGTVDARVAAENALVNGTAPAKLQAAVAQATALLPIEIKRAYALADAAGSASERHRQQPGAELEAKLAIVEKTLGRKLTEQEQLGLLGLAKARDPELDTQTVTEEKMNPDGTTTKTTRKEVRRPGQSASGESAPYPDGTELRDKSGAIFVVRGGVPTPKNAEQPKPEAKPAAKPGILPQSTDPLDGLSRQQIREKRDELLSERERWANTPAAKARVDEIDALVQRIDNGQYNVR